jgi:hypothetical protein
VPSTDVVEIGQAAILGGNGIGRDTGIEQLLHDRAELFPGRGLVGDAGFLEQVAVIADADRVAAAGRGPHLAVDRDRIDGDVDVLSKIDRIGDVHQRPGIDVVVHFRLGRNHVEVGPGSDVERRLDLGLVLIVGRHLDLDLDLGMRRIEIGHDGLEGIEQLGELAPESQLGRVLIALKEGSGRLRSRACRGDLGRNANAGCNAGRFQQVSSRNSGFALVLHVDTSIDANDRNRLSAFRAASSSPPQPTRTALHRLRLATCVNILGYICRHVNRLTSRLSLSFIRSASILGEVASRFELFPRARG